MIALTKKPRAERTLEYYFGEIMEAAISMFLVCVPEYDRDRFIKEFYEPLKNIRVSGDSIMHYFSQEGGSKLGKGDAALTACIYCIESGWARVEGLTELAWVKLMDAQRFIAFAVAEDVSEPQLAKILDLARTEAKKNAAKESVAVSVQPWREANQEALRLIREKARDGRRWEHAEQAALEILDSVSEFLKSRESKSPKRFWTDAPEKTIARWLLEMPEAAVIFGKK